MEPIDSSEVKTSLYTYMTTFGVDDWLFIFNAEVTVMMVFILKIFQWAVLAVLLHFVLMMVTKMSPRLMECYFAHLRQANRYWPGESPLQKRGQRPVMFLRVKA